VSSHRPIATFSDSHRGLRANFSPSGILRRPVGTSFISFDGPSRVTLRTHNEWPGKVDRLGQPFFGAQSDQPVALHLG
jgi:hypothetical protein